MDKKEKLQHRKSIPCSILFLRETKTREQAREALIMCDFYKSDEDIEKELDFIYSAPLETLKDECKRKIHLYHKLGFVLSDSVPLTLELVEDRLKDISKRYNIDLMDERVLYFYTKEYGSLTNEIADILFPRYGFKGIYPTPKLETKEILNMQLVDKYHQLLQESEITLKNGKIVIPFYEMRKNVKKLQITENDMRRILSSYPKDYHIYIDEIVQKIYHPTKDDLKIEEERKLW